MPQYRQDEYWHGYRTLTLTDAQARAMRVTLAIVLNDSTWPFSNHGERIALSNTLDNLNKIMSKRIPERKPE